MTNADDQKELFEILFAIGLNAVFLALIAVYSGFWVSCPWRFVSRKVT